MRLKHPMAHGVVQDWDDMERIWRFAFQELAISTKEHPFLLTECPNNPRKNRREIAKLFFETFNVPALFLAVQAVLCLYASGKITGIVLDSGDGVTHCVPVYEGFSVSHAVGRIDLAGRDITEYLMLLLRRNGVNFHTSAEFDIVRRIKEAKCVVREDPDPKVASN